MNQPTITIDRDKLRQTITTVLTFHQHGAPSSAQLRCSTCGVLRSTVLGAGADSAMAAHQADAIMHALNRLDGGAR